MTAKQRASKEKIEAFQDMKKWVEADDCLCEDSWETFNKCCGKKLSIFESLETYCSKERVRPRFKDTPIDFQNQVLAIIEKGKFD